MNPYFALVLAALAAAFTYGFARRKVGLQFERDLVSAKSEFEKQLELLAAGNRLPAEFGTSNDADSIPFLYDKRLTLFNIRREHEWKIYFGAMALLGAVDAALVSGRLVLAGWPRWAWVFGCVVVFVVIFGYERDLQIKNRADRRAMNTLYNRICDLVGIGVTDSSVRTRIEAAYQIRRGIWSRYGWAFPWQMILLFVAAATSAYLPFR